MQHHGSKYFACRPHPSTPPPDPGVGVSRQNLTFSEHGYVAYQIKRNCEMQQHGSKCFAHIPPPQRP